MSVVETGYVDNVIDSLQWDYRDQYIKRVFPHATNPNIFIILSSDSGVETRVTTIMADDDGIITFIDDMQIAASAVSTAGGLCHVNGDIYCASYLFRWGGSPTAKIATFSCDINGLLGAVVDSFGFGGVAGSASNILYRPDIVSVPGGTKFAVVATCGGDDGWLFTIDIDAAGNIAAAVTDQWEFDNFNGRFPRIFNRTGNVFVIYYSRNGVFNLRTVSIAADGTIGAQIDSAGGGLCHYGAKMVQIDGDLWCAIYSTGALGWTQGRVELYDIDNTGNIASLQGRYIYFDYMSIPEMVVVGDNIIGTRKIMCIVTTGQAGDKTILTIEISNNGNIFTDIVDSAVVSETLRSSRYDVINIHDQLYLFIYDLGTGAPNPGWAETRLINGLVVSTQAPSDIETYIATLNGQLVYDEMQACDVRFEYGKYPNFGYYTDWQSGKRMGEWFSDNVELAPGVMYQFRAQAKSVSGITKGITRTFNTVSMIDGSPVVVTGEATEVLSSFATLNGSVGFDGYEVCVCWLEYGVDTTYGIETSKHRGLVSGDTFSNLVSELSPGQSYHMRAVLVDASGRKVYGQDKTFSTLSERGEATGLDFALIGLMED